MRPEWSRVNRSWAAQRGRRLLDGRHQELHQIGARLRHQRWKLDAEGLWLRTGRLWWRETRVPASRVQHVDLKHGPLERRFKLATLVVHTAAVHLSGITVRGLDEGDAQRLRDALARQLDDAGDAL